MEAIYAVDLHNGLSKHGIIPWKSKKDLSFFASKTKNNVVIMGRHTYFSLPDNVRPLKDRLNIVLTSNLVNKEIKNVLFTNNIHIYKEIQENKDAYIQQYPYLKSDFIIFVIGGKQIYDKLIPICNKVWVTQIKKEYDCDLLLDYHYENSHSCKNIEEDDELTILVYEKL